MSVVPSGMFVPVTLRPLSAAVKFAVSDVTCSAQPSTRLRRPPPGRCELSILNVVPAGIAAMVGRFSVTKHAPEIDMTKLVRVKTTGNACSRSYDSRKPVADVQSVAVNVVEAAGMAAVFVIVRAAPLCYTTLAEVMDRVRRRHEVTTAASGVLEDARHPQVALRPRPRRILTHLRAGRSRRPYNRSKGWVCLRSLMAQRQACLSPPVRTELPNATAIGAYAISPLGLLVDSWRRPGLWAAPAPRNRSF